MNNEYGTSGIYKILNLVNGEFYIGSAKKLSKRKSSHLNKLRKNKHENSKLQNAFNKYSEEYFVFEVIEKCPVEVLLEREQYYLDTLKPFYNICFIAYSRLGVSFSEETKLKISETWKNKYKNGFEHPWLGREHSTISKEKMSKTKKEMFIGENNPFFGKKHSKATKKKISEIRKLKGLGKGEDSANAKLTEENVRQIRSMYLNEKIEQKEIAKIFGVKPGCISKIITGRSWAWLE